MSTTLYPPSAEFAATAHINSESYKDMYEASVNNQDAFWQEHGKRIDWIKPFTKTKNVSFSYSGSNGNPSFLLSQLVSSHDATPWSMKCTL